MNRTTPFSDQRRLELSRDWWIEHAELKRLIRQRDRILGRNAALAARGVKPLFSPKPGRSAEDKLQVRIGDLQAKLHRWY